MQFLLLCHGVSALQYQWFVLCYTCRWYHGVETCSELGSGNTRKYELYFGWKFWHSDHHNSTVITSPLNQNQTMIKGNIIHSTMEYCKFACQH